MLKEVPQGEGKRQIRNSDLKKGRVLERKEMKVKFHIPEVKHTHHPHDM